MSCFYSFPSTAGQAEHSAIAHNIRNEIFQLSNQAQKARQFTKCPLNCQKTTFSILLISNLLKALGTLAWICGDSILICKVNKSFLQKSYNTYWYLGFQNLVHLFLSAYENETNFLCPRNGKMTTVSVCSVASIKWEEMFPNDVFNSAICSLYTYPRSTQLQKSPSSFNLT